VQNGSGAHAASYPMGTRGSFPGGKVVGVWSYTHLHPVPRSKNAWSYTSTHPNTNSRRNAQFKTNHRDNFTFTLYRTNTCITELLVMYFM